MRKLCIRFDLLSQHTTHCKFFLNLLGSILAVLGVIFVSLRLAKYSEHVNYQILDEKKIIFFILIAIIYGCASLILGCVWRGLLSFSGENKGYGWAIRLYGISQLAKYVPGNIFHFAGRQAMGMAQGAGPKALAKSTLYELILLVCCGSLFFLMAIPAFYEGFALLPAVSIFCLVVIFIYFSLRHQWGKDLASSFLLQILFLLISGLTFVCVVSFIVRYFDFSLSNVIVIAASFVTAWLIGLVTPGAPAGLGVRELVLLFLLKTMIKEQDLLLSIVVSRIITVSGDVIFFLISFFLPKFNKVN